MDGHTVSIGLVHAQVAFARGGRGRGFVLLPFVVFERLDRPAQHAGLEGGDVLGDSASGGRDLAADGRGWGASIAGLLSRPYPIHRRILSARPIAASRPESRVALSRLPREPVPPRVFFHDTVPALFSELALRDEEREIELKVGVVLYGVSGAVSDETSSEASDGGAWTLHFVRGELGIADGRADDCDVTIVQSVEDWRSAIWGGRPRLVADLVEAIDQARPDELRSIGDANRPHNPDALRELRELQGRIDAVIPEAGRDAEGPSEWRLGIVVGQGAIPEMADATILLGSVEAEAMRRGELHPVEALITGQLRLEGDLGLIIRLQAIAMAAAMPASTSAAAPSGPKR